MCTLLPSPQKALLVSLGLCLPCVLVLFDALSFDDHCVSVCSYLGLSDPTLQYYIALGKRTKGGLLVAEITFWDNIQ